MPRRSQVGLKLVKHIRATARLRVCEFCKGTKVYEEQPCNQCDENGNSNQLALGACSLIEEAWDVFSPPNPHDRQKLTFFDCFFVRKLQGGLIHKACGSEIQQFRRHAYCPKCHYPMRYSQKDTPQDKQNPKRIPGSIRDEEIFRIEAYDSS